MPPDAASGQSLRDLAEAMAQGDPSHKAGMAVYFLASLLNHDCEPNLDVVFPHNNCEPSTASCCRLHHV